MSVYPVEYKRNGKKAIKFRVQIKRKNFTFDEYFDNQQDAEKKNDEILYQLKHGNIKTLSFKELGQTPTLEQLLEDYFEQVCMKIGTDHLGYELTVKGNKNRLTRIIPNTLLFDIEARKPSRADIKFINPDKNSTSMQVRMGDILITSFNKEKWLIKEYIEARRAGCGYIDNGETRTLKGVSDSTIKKEISLLSQAFTYANELYDHLDEAIFNPVLLLSKNEKPKKGRPKKTKLTDKQMEEILEYFKMRANQEAYFVHKIGYTTGLRKTEILMGFTKENITYKDDGTSIMNIPFTKNTKEIFVQLDREVTSFLKGKKYNEKEQRFFFMTAWNLQRYIEDCRKQSGITEWSFHDLRRKSISNMILGNNSSAHLVASELNLSIQSIEPLLRQKRILEIIDKMKQGTLPTDEEISLLHNHSTQRQTNGYFSKD